jgi:hypothetical protein
MYRPSTALVRVAAVNRTFIFTLLPCLRRSGGSSSSGGMEQSVQPGCYTKTDLATFEMEAVADFRTVDAVAPSSRFLTQAMLRPLPLRRALVVVELGSGTGMKLLHQYFRSVQRRVIWRNLPPAFVFVSREALCGETTHLGVGRHEI